MSEPEIFFFADDGTIPNSPLPLLVYRAAMAADARAMEERFAANRWPPAWRDGVFPWHHFHPHAHEALGVASGSARVMFGGPNGTEILLGAGDVVVVPAGVGHCGVEASKNLVIVGAYPAGTREREASRGAPGRHTEHMAAVAQVPVPAADPLAGAEGALCRLWSSG